MPLNSAGLSVSTQLQSGLIVMVQGMKQVGHARAVGQELGFQESNFRHPPVIEH